MAAFIEWCLAHETGPGERLYNYCDVPAYDMNTLVLDVYRALGRPKRMLVHFPYPLAYLGGLCFDLLALVTRRKFAVSAIRVKKFTQDTYFTSNRVPATGFVPPVPLEEGLRRTIDWEFVRRVDGSRSAGSECVSLTERFCKPCRIMLSACQHNHLSLARLSCKA